MFYSVHGIKTPYSWTLKCSINLHTRIHSFNISNRFISFWVTMKQEMIPGTLREKWEYTLYGMCVSHQALLTHSLRPRCNLWLSIQLACLWEVFLWGSHGTHCTSAPHQKHNNIFIKKKKSKALASSICCKIWRQLHSISNRQVIWFFSGYRKPKSIFYAVVTVY